MLLAVRDRFGVKPLYVAQVDGAYIFASEIKSLLRYPGAFRGFNRDKVSAYLTHCLVDDDRDTLFYGVRSVEPGTFLELSRSGENSGRFWSLPIASACEARHSEHELIQEFRVLLADAVKLRVRSDVPIGTMLSGGLDSTAITALIHKQKTSSEQSFDGLRGFHHTFSACWPGWESDEEADVDLLCSKLGLESHKLYPTAESLHGVMSEALYHLEEPLRLRPR